MVALAGGPQDVVGFVLVDGPSLQVVLFHVPADSRVDLAICPGGPEEPFLLLLKPARNDCQSERAHASYCQFYDGIVLHCHFYRRTVNHETPGVQVILLVDSRPRSNK